MKPAPPVRPPRGGEALFLAFDTSGPHVAAVLSESDVPLGVTLDEMKRGQAEALMPALEALLAGAGIRWSDLTALGVGIGPGNFTGTRLSVAAARGLSLATGLPAVPLSSFELARDPDGPGAGAAQLVVLEAPRGRAYAQLFRYGRPQSTAELIDPGDPPEALRRVNLEVIGYRAEEIARAYEASWSPASTEALPRRMAKLVDWKWTNGHDARGRPAPLYVRPADAAPASDPPPVILP